MPTSAARRNTTWRSANAVRWRRATTCSRSVLRPTGCVPSATARNSPSTPATPKQHSRRTAARTLSLPANRGQMMKRFAVSVVCVLLAVATPAVADDKTHQQIMAELRMLQEQQSQLAQTLAGLVDTLKTVTTRIDEQTSGSRKTS